MTSLACWAARRAILLASTADSAANFAANAACAEARTDSSSACCATYVFTVPSAALQISVSAATRDQLFQSSMQMYPDMMRKSGAQVEQQAFDHRGRQALLMVAKLREPQSGTPMQTLNVFLPGPNVWLQVSGPEQSAAQIESTMRGLLDALQTP